MPESTLTVAPCATLREVAGVTDVPDGDVFFTGEAPRGELAFGATTWTLPAGAREVAPRADPTGLERGGVFATPGRGARRRAARAVSCPSSCARTRRRPDTLEQVRNAAAAIDPRACTIQELHRTRTDGQFAQLRRAMLIGASIVIGLIGLSLLLTALEQLRERRRLLAVLVAFGTRRSTLSWSVLWQSAVPVALGIGIAVMTGIALGCRAAADPGDRGAGRLGGRRRDGRRRRGGRPAGDRGEPAGAVADYATGGAANGVASAPR